MCGLAGVIHWNEQPVPAEELSGMSALLKHRGPDECGSASPAPWVGLCHTRLSVIDLSPAARQPMGGPDLWLCFNGEIYNFRELRKELEGLGCTFRSRSDTEVILKAYEQWGTAAFARLDGMFAIALWDQRKRELLLARDRTGKKPLYYLSDGTCLCFGSEIKAMRVHPHAQTPFDERTLPHLLALGYPPPGGSCYEKIRQLPPACWASFRENREPELHRYWELPEQTWTRKPIEEAVRELRELMNQAVRRRLISDVPLGAFLSGGIDSSIVTGLMAAQTGRPVKTFSIGFEGDAQYDETSFARLAARKFKTDHTEFVVRPQPFELLEKIVWHLDQPFGDSSALPVYLLCQLTRAKVTVALNGDGGDELFAGYDRFTAALAAEKVPPAILSLGQRTVRILPLGGRERSIGGKLRKFFAAPQGLEQRFMSWTGYFREPQEILGKEGAGFTLPTLPSGGRALSPLQRLLRLNFLEYLPNDLHVKMDRCSMAHGLETRSPFLDTALVEWAFKLPDPLKLRGGTGKWILRQAFPELLPTEILNRKKMGFGVPLGAWFRGQWRDPLRDTLLSPQAQLRRYLRPEAVERLLQRHLEGKEDAGQRLWLLLTFELWLRQMNGVRILR